MGYCQEDSNVVYDEEMNLRNILWLAPMPGSSSKDWDAPGGLVVLDAHPGGIIYRDLIPDYVHTQISCLRAVLKNENLTQARPMARRHTCLGRVRAVPCSYIFGLPVQLCRRFRVVVDRHLYARRISFSSSVGDGRCASVLSRVIDHVRDFRRKSISTASSSSSAALSRIKRVKQKIYAEEESAITRMVQAVAVPIIGNVSHVFMHGLNRVQIYGAEKLVNAVKQKSKDKPLVTVSNHVASIDDPLIIASLLPPSVLMDAQNLRWTLYATDRCFKTPATSGFFRSVKVLPISRGDGIYQKGLDIAISKLNNGGWVHIFPEGSRSRDGGETVGSAKKGVGRLVVDADNTPMVVPFVHTGMQDIMPIGAKFPRIGKTVTVLIGDPMEFDDLLNSEETKFLSREDLYDCISSRSTTTTQSPSRQFGS